MADIDIDIEVDKKSVEKAIRALKRGLNEGAYESAKWAAGEYEDVAQDTIRGRRMWNREVYHGFRQKHRRKNHGAIARVYNPVQHAEIVNYGRRPGQKAPQAQHIIEWVDDKVFAALMADGGFGADDPDAGEAWSDHAAVTRNVDIERITPLQDLDDDEADQSTANASELKKIHFENGDTALFSPHRGISADFGATYNEVAYHQLLNELDLKDPISKSFPESRLWNIEQDGDVTDGFMMTWSEEGAGRPVIDHLKTYHRPNNFRQVEDWLDDEEHRQFLARVGVMDYLMGNGDRHLGNMLYGTGGRPIAIDNGGQAEPFGTFSQNSFRKKRFTPVDAIVNLNTQDFDTDEYIIFDPDKAKRHAEDIFNRQENILRELSDNPEYREELIEMMQNVHPEDSKWYEFFERAWSDDSDWRYAIFVEDDYDWGGREMWEWDLKQLRDELQEAYDDRMQDDPTKEIHDSSATVQDKIDDILGKSESGILGDIDDEFDDI